MPRVEYEYGDHLPLPVVARLLGLSDQALYRAVRQAKILPIVRRSAPPSNQLVAQVPLAELQRAYGPFSAERIKLASRPATRPKRKWPAKYSGRAVLDTVNANLLARDAEWVAFCRQRFNYAGPIPPRSEPQAPDHGE